jgi:hypothetical protein
VLNRAAATIAIILTVAVAAFLVWTNREGIGHAASRLDGGAAAASPSVSASPEPSPTAPDADATLGMAGQPAPPLFSPAQVNVSVNGSYSWALLDRRTGAISGSANYTTWTNSTESMIKAWISSDYLRRLGNTAPAQSRLDELTQMIRDSDDNAAEDIYDVDGYDDVVQRMITICGLTETSIFDGWWSRTQVSARDAVRLGACVADGRAAGPKWTNWILNEMRQVRGEGRFGIIDWLPAGAAGQTSIKNGWTIVGDDWHLDCLAIVDQYVLAVLTRFPSELGLQYGAGICRNVTTQLQPRG